MGEIKGVNRLKKDRTPTRIPRARADNTRKAMPDAEKVSLSVSSNINHGKQKHDVAERVLGLKQKKD